MTEELQNPVETPAVQAEEETPRTIHGGRNLMILGFSSIIIAIITTAISLVVYRATGDIYLDRSRPGYISENETDDKKYDAKETISTEGEVSKNTIDEYLNQLDSVRGRIDSLSNTFDPDPLDDDALAIYPREDEIEE
ncbi:hypothetical protein J5500_01365 [Candidatus Saccharibacteria bacterium]|nr:hypothetical protein [Candidatus Saccharibacteria bacterium]